MQNKQMEMNTGKILPFFKRPFEDSCLQNYPLFLNFAPPIAKKSFSRKWVRAWYRFWSGVWGVHNDVIKWKHFSRYWPFVWAIHRSPVNSPHKSQWRKASMFSLICAWINAWENNGEAGDLRRIALIMTSLWWGGGGCGLRYQYNTEWYRSLYRTGECIT